MTELEKFLDLYINEDLIRIIISGPRKKEGPSKIQIRPLLLKGRVMYQVTRTVGQKELHENHEREEVLCLTDNWMQQDFRQLQLEAKGIQGTVLASKKGRLTIKTKKTQGREDFVPMLTHNRQKKYLLQEGVPVPYLIDLGIMNEAGRIKNARYDKFKQLNRFLEFIDVEHTPKNLLIRAVKNENKTVSRQQRQAWEKCTEEFHAHPTLASLLFLEE